LELTEVDSTSAEALRRARGGERGPLWILAAQQSAGRGRRGNGWQSPLGNLYASLLIRPGTPVGDWAQLSFAAALAASDMVAAFAPAAAVTVKWPNDVLAEGRKIAGLLLEAAGDALVIGIGVNLCAHPEKTPYGAVSLIALGQTPPTPQDALLELAAAFEKWQGLWRQDGFAPLREAWLARAQGLGGRILVRLPKKELSGRFEGIDDGGALLLKLAGGEVRTVAAGDVFFSEEG
jgi:BirA family transcriptional regulator, biotin operon repressor / biotin---[acetyl-CoA-carboxylase] ligase